MDPESIKTFTIHITGKVQGVWYRASAKDKAISLGLTGKIWNQPDGNVGALVQGPMNKIFEFIEWCKEGPPLAKVEEVLYEETIDVVRFESFEISRYS
jgi:acylphosphatase